MRTSPYFGLSFKLQPQTHSFIHTKNQIIERMAKNMSYLILSLFLLIGALTLLGEALYEFKEKFPTILK